MRIAPSTLAAALTLLVLAPSVAPSQDVPPDCNLARPSRAELTPPDGSLVEISVEGLVDEFGDPADITILGVTQDEPLDGAGPDDTCPDATGVGDEVAFLRAQRHDDGDGRVYRVRFLADVDGEECEGTVTVCVPRDGQCVDGGGAVDSTSGQCGTPCDATRCDATCSLGCTGGVPPDPCAAPADELVAIGCTLDEARRSDECGAITLPPRIAALLDRATASAARAGQSTGRPARRHVKRARRALVRLTHLLARARATTFIGEDCVDELAWGVEDARDEADAWLGR